jgi:hypothetical protein
MANLPRLEVPPFLPALPQFVWEVGADWPARPASQSGRDRSVRRTPQAASACAGSTAAQVVRTLPSLSQTRPHRNK